MGTNNVVIRISGQGQFKVNSEILEKINGIDNSIVDLIKNNSSVLETLNLIKKNYNQNYQK
jgi:archaellum component FlaC